MIKLYKVGVMVKAIRLAKRMYIHKISLDLKQSTFAEKIGSHTGKIWSAKSRETQNTKKETNDYCQ